MMTVLSAALSWGKKGPSPCPEAFSGPVMVGREEMSNLGAELGSGVEVAPASLGVASEPAFPVSV